MMSLSVMAQGTIKVNNDIRATLATYDASGGDTSWVIPLSNGYKWGVQLDFASMTGTQDATVQIYVSMNEGVSYVEYPNFEAKVINKPTITYDDEYTVYDAIKVVFTANSVTGGTITINERLISNPR